MDTDGDHRWVYALDVRLSIRKTEERYQDGRWINYGSQPGQLDVTEQLPLGQLDFQGMLAVLARLHDAVADIKTPPRSVTLVIRELFGLGAEAPVVAVLTAPITDTAASRVTLELPAVADRRPNSMHQTRLAIDVHPVGVTNA